MVWKSNSAAIGTVSAILLACNQEIVIVSTVIGLCDSLIETTQLLAETIWNNQRLCLHDFAPRSSIWQLFKYVMPDVSSNWKKIQIFSQWFLEIAHNFRHDMEAIRNCPQCTNSVAECIAHSIINHD